MTEIMIHPADAGAVVQAGRAELSAARMEEMAGMIRSLAEMLRVTNERLAGMEAALRTLEKATPQQAGEIGKAIRARAGEICEAYRMGVTVTPVEPGRGSVPERAAFEANAEKRKAVAAAIRRDVRILTGAKTAREIARIDVPTVLDAVRGWDDLEEIRKIRKGGGSHG